MTFIKTTLVTFLYLLISCTNTYASEYTKIKGSYQNIKFLALFTPNTTQENGVNIIKDILASLINKDTIARFINEGRNHLNSKDQQSLIICESCLESNSVNVCIFTTLANKVTRTKVINEDDDHNTREYHCYYGNCSISEVEVSFSQRTV